jgi:hypothetical protein
VCVVSFDGGSSSNHIALSIVRVCPFLKELFIKLLELRRRVRKAVTVGVLFAFLEVHGPMQLFLVLGTRDVALESLGLMNIVALVLLTLIAVSFHNRRRWLIDLVSILAAAQILAHHRVFLLRR